MKYTTLLILFTLTPIILFAQSWDLSKYPALKIAKETSLYRNDVNWEAICEQYMKLAESPDSNYSHYEFLLNALGDDHGAFRNAKTFQIIAHATLQSNDQRAFNSKFHNEVLNDLNARFSYKLMDGKIGYLKVVGIGPQHPMEEDAGLIQNAIAELQGKGVNKWIVDLRFNGGGNMNPMLSGLSALLGKGNIGGSSDKSGLTIQDYEIKNNQFIDSGRNVIDIKNPVEEVITDKLAVLLSKYTASSGEVVAVAFKGRGQTRFFGERTRGKTTVTGFDRIDDETLMLISKAYYRDRLGNIYENGVNPDVEIPFEEFGPFEKDQIIQKSVLWLKKND
jgi:carboxyl-terminal processing protease